MYIYLKNLNEVHVYLSQEPQWSACISTSRTLMKYMYIYLKSLNEVHVHLPQEP